MLRPILLLVGRSALVVGRAGLAAGVVLSAIMEPSLSQTPAVHVPNMDPYIRGSNPLQYMAKPRLPPLHMPALSPQMAADPEVDGARLMALGLADGMCASNPAMTSDYKRQTCRRRLVAPLAMGMGFGLAAVQVARNEHVAVMNADDLRFALKRVDNALDPQQQLAIFNRLWDQKACPGDWDVACEQRAQFNAGLTIGVEKFTSGNAAHMFDDLKHPLTSAPPIAHPPQR